MKSYAIKQLQSMTDAELSRVAFDAGLAPKGYGLSEGGIVCVKDSPYGTLLDWNPPRQGRLDQAVGIANDQFREWDWHSWHERYEIRVFDFIKGFITVPFERGQEARALTIACILAQQAKKGYK